MRHAEAAVEQVGQAGVEVDLDQDRHRQQRDDQRLRQDLLALEAEQQDQRRQQRRSDETGCSRSSTGFRTPGRAQQRRPPAWAMSTGMTMNSTTEITSVSHGTVIAESPSSRPTIGAKATTMMASLSATWLSVKCGSPSQRFDQTNTIAVQGAAARMIRPAM